ncbi:MAG: hypothetical protein ABIH99_02645 [Candidatus Micrarchaeota archaeon]
MVEINKVNLLDVDYTLGEAEELVNKLIEVLKSDENPQHRENAKGLLKMIYSETRTRGRDCASGIYGVLFDKIMKKLEAELHFAGNAKKIRLSTDIWNIVTTPIEQSIERKRFPRPAGNCVKPAGAQQKDIVRR